MNKGLSALLCFSPIVVYLLVSVPLMVLTVGVEMGTIPEDDFSVTFALLLLVGALVLVVLVYGVMIWLIVKSVKNPMMSTTEKVVWSICLYMFNVVAYPIYWIVYIRKE